MKKTHLSVAVITLIFAIIGFVSSANAVQYTVNDNLVDNLLISAGQTLNGNFDLNPALPTDDQYVLPYDISSASATFNFMDDGDVHYTGSTTGSTSLTAQYHYPNGNANYYYTRSSYDYFIDSLESASVQLSSFELSEDGTNWYNTGAQYDGSSSYTTGTSHYHTYRYRCGWISWCTGRDYDYIYSTTTTNNYDQTTGYNGGFSMSMDLGMESIADLSFDGIIDFTVTGTTGDVIYQSGTLTADVNPNPVPEPGTILLLGTGLAGIAVYTRKKRKK